CSCKNSLDIKENSHQIMQYSLHLIKNRTKSRKIRSTPQNNAPKWTYVKKVDSTVSLNEPFFYLRTTLFESFGSLCIMERIKNRFLPLHRGFLVFDEPLLLAHLMARLQF